MVRITQDSIDYYVSVYSDVSGEKLKENNIYEYNYEQYSYKEILNKLGVQGPVDSAGEGERCCICGCRYTTEDENFVLAGNCYCEDCLKDYVYDEYGVSIDTLFERKLDNI